MKIFPAIDLRGGRCVRLQQGQFDRERAYDADPVELAQRYEAAGARYLHIVDLDGAKAGTMQQAALALTMTRATKLAVQVGGGVRSDEHVAALLDAGVARVVVGSLAVQSPDVVLGWMQKFGAERITLAIDVRIDHAGTARAAVHGWQEGSTTTLDEALRPFDDGCPLLCTDIARDGMMEGPNFALYESLRHAHPKLRILASGGVRTADDIAQLRTLGLDGAVIGRALYEGTVRLEDLVHAE